MNVVQNSKGSLFHLRKHGFVPYSLVLGTIISSESAAGPGDVSLRS